jgi:hypothetical protein
MNNDDEEEDEEGERAWKSSILVTAGRSTVTSVTLEALLIDTKTALPPSVGIPTQTTQKNMLLISSSMDVYPSCCRDVRIGWYLTPLSRVGSAGGIIL